MNKLEAYENSLLKLFPGSIVVRGATRSLILDIQRKKFDFIPNTLATILSDYENKKIKEVYKAHKDHSDTLDEYFNFLIENDHLILNTITDPFPNLNIESNYFGELNDCIIDGDRLCLENYKKIIGELIQLGCFNIEIRLFDEISAMALKEILAILNGSPIRCVDLIMKYSRELEACSKEIAYNQQRIRKLVLHSSPEDKVIHFGVLGQQFIVTYKNKIGSSACCGAIFPEMFVVNKEMYIAAATSNSCLNRKISIDVEGNIKNCPSLPESYGNISNTTLKEALEMPGFKKYWSITKDQVDICKDCEFRYICTDCRAYVEHPEDILSKPLKCGYNPYTCEWEEWSTNPLKQETIQYYGM